jgi:hypothetical protein
MTFTRQCSCAGINHRSFFFMSDIEVYYLRRTFKELLKSCVYIVNYANIPLRTWYLVYLDQDVENKIGVTSVGYINKSGFAALYNTMYALSGINYGGLPRLFDIILGKDH